MGYQADNEAEEEDKVKPWAYWAAFVFSLAFTTLIGMCCSKTVEKTRKWRRRSLFYSNEEAGSLYSDFVENPGGTVQELTTQTIDVEEDVDTVQELTTETNDVEEDVESPQRDTELNNVVFQSELFHGSIIFDMHLQLTTTGEWVQVRGNESRTFVLLSEMILFLGSPEVSHLVEKLGSEEVNVGMGRTESIHSLYCHCLDSLENNSPPTLELNIVFREIRKREPKLFTQLFVKAPQVFCLKHFDKVEDHERLLEHHEHDIPV